MFMLLPGELGDTTHLSFVVRRVAVERQVHCQDRRALLSKVLQLTLNALCALKRRDRHALPHVNAGILQQWAHGPVNVT